jgi:hypothetical protein
MPTEIYDPIIQLGARLFVPERDAFLAEHVTADAYGAAFVDDLRLAVLSGDAAAAQRVSDELAPGVRLSVLATGDILYVGYRTDAGADVPGISGQLTFRQNNNVTQALVRVAVAIQVHTRHVHMELSRAVAPAPSAPSMF